MIINKTTKKTIAENYKLCKSPCSRVRGLMFSKKKDLIFVFGKGKRISLHMLFVFFPIWAVYLNEKKEAVFIKKLHPFISVCRPKEKAKYILELVKEPNVNIGDRIEWK
jgi:uncharacterized membrane protein (UPF0127 family)